MPRFPIALFLFLLPPTFGGPTALGIAAENTWLTGKAFSDRLQQSLSVTWKEVPLRQALRDLGDSQQIAILLDRRIDPDRTLSLEVPGEPIVKILESVAAARQAALSLPPGVVYVGPPDVAKKLRTAIELLLREVSRFPPEARKSWLKTQSLSWNDLAAPRQILEQIAKQSGVRLEGTERIPHDLWAAASLPPLSTILRASLVLAQFDLTLKLAAGGRTAQLIPLPDRCAIERRFSGGQQLADKWSRLAPDAKISVIGNQVVVQARIEEIERLTARPAPHAPIASLGDSLDKLQIDNLTLEKLPLEQVLTALAQRLGLQLQFDVDQLRAAGIKLDQPIDLMIKKATVDEGLRQALAPAGLSFERTGRKVRIFPAAK